VRPDRRPEATCLNPSVKRHPSTRVIHRGCVVGRRRQANAGVHLSPRRSPSTKSRSVGASPPRRRLNQARIKSHGAARLRARAGSVFSGMCCAGGRHCILRRLSPGFHGVGLGRVVLVDRQQTARGRLIGRDRGEAETDVGLAAKISGTRHAKTTPIAANAKPAQAFHAKKGLLQFFFSGQDHAEPKFQARLVPAQRRRRCPG
jgi:hypothetical protein